MAACQDTSPANNETADDYAARLNGGPTQPVQAEPTGQVVPPRPTPKPTPTPSWADGMLTADMAHCDADKVAPFLGQKDSPATRQAIKSAVGPDRQMRFVMPGITVTPNAKSNRLNVMIDITGVVRTARCG